MTMHRISSRLGATKGVAMRALGRHGAAKIAYDRALDLNPHDKFSWLNRWFLPSQVKELSRGF